MEASNPLVNLSFAEAKTQTPGEAWRQSSDEQRTALVAKTLQGLNRDFAKAVAVAVAKENGQVFVNLLEPMPAAMRGTLLLDVEQSLKDGIDPGLVVWLEPMGDRNSLRNLRGIEVKQ